MCLILILNCYQQLINSKVCPSIYHIIPIIPVLSYLQLNPESHPVFVYYLYKKESSGCIEKTGPIKSIESPCICLLPVKEGKVWWYYRKLVQLTP